MNLSRSLKIRKNEVKISDIFPITHLNTPSIFESRDGLIGAVLRIDGIAFEIAETETLNYYNFLLHRTLLSLDERFIVYVTTHRKKVSSNLTGEFSSNFTKELNNRYFDKFKDQSLYANDLYITIVLKGDTSSKTSSAFNWIERAIGKNLSEISEQRRESQIAILTQTIKQLYTSLGQFGAILLGERDNILGYSELINFLSIVINAGQPLAYNFPTYNPAIANDIPNTFKLEQVYPNGHLGQYISRYYLLFGEYIQFQGNTENDVRFGAILSIKKYPTVTSSILLDNLLSLDCEFIATHTFAPLAREASLKTVMQKRSKLVNTEDKSFNQINALHDLDDDIASEHVRLGIHSHTLMLFASTKSELQELILETTKRYANNGIVVVNETLGIEPSFWSQIPCNQHLIARAALITSQNFVDFCPLHNTTSGFKQNNFLNNAVTLLETPSKTPVFFNYHSKGSSTNPTKGHTAIFGGNNAGKTTLVNFLDAQMGRFKGQSFFIDRDESSKIYILACGNSSYIKINPINSIAMNPLKLPDTLDNRAFLKIWLGSLLQEKDEINIPNNIAEIVNECIDYAFEQLSTEYRTLSNISRFLPMNFPRWPHLKRWLKGNNDRIDGEFHWLFDNENDALNFDFDKVGFDVTYLLDNVPPSITTPVYLYLVHRMRQCLDGRLTSFVIDEAWQIFSSPFWEKCLKEWLPTIRKKNGHFIFMTQSPKTVTTSAIKHIVLDNLATMLVFPNPLADEETYMNNLNLTLTQFQAIKDNTPESRIFLYKQEQEAMLCKLDLGGMNDLIRVLSGNIKSIRLCDSIRAEVGDDPNIWLPIFLDRSSQ